MSLISFTLDLLCFFFPQACTRLHPQRHTPRTSLRLGSYDNLLRRARLRTQLDRLRSSSSLSTSCPPSSLSVVIRIQLVAACLQISLGGRKDHRRSSRRPSIYRRGSDSACEEGGGHTKPLRRARRSPATSVCPEAQQLSRYV